MLSNPWKSMPDCANVVIENKLSYPKPTDFQKDPLEIDQTVNRYSSHSSGTLEFEVDQYQLSWVKRNLDMLFRDVSNEKFQKK